MVGEGSNRKVYSLGEGHVLKIPKSNPVKAWMELVGLFKRGGIEPVKRIIEHGGAGVYHSPQWYLFRGIEANRLESKLAKSHPDIVVRSKRILGGLAVIQERVKSLPESADLQSVFAKYLGWGLGHLIDQPGNFGIVQGKVKIVDGGDEKLAEALRRPDRTMRIKQALSELTLANLERPL